MGLPLRVLVLEDNEDDYLQIKRELIRGGYDVHSVRVQTAADLKAALGNGAWDVILSDFTMPQFDAIKGLKILNESELDVPCIIVSGTIGEDTAVEAMKAGASDYFVKGNLKRLCPAVERELREAKIRRERRNADRRVATLLERLDLATKAAKLGIWDWDVKKNEMIWDDRMYELYGVRREDFPGTYEAWLEMIHPEDRAKSDEVACKALQNDRNSDNEFRVIRPDGSVRSIKGYCVIERDGQGAAVRMTGVNLDITEQKLSERLLKESLSETRRREAESRGLFDAARAVLEFQSFQASARRIFDACRLVTGAVSGYVALLSEDGSENEVLFLEAGGMPCNVAPSLPMPVRGLRAESYSTGKVVYDNDFMKGEHVELMPSGHVELKNVMFAPLVIGDKVVGVIGLANKPEDFNEYDAEVARAFGDMAAIALRRARSEEALRESEARNRAMLEANPDIMFLLDKDYTFLDYKDSPLGELLVPPSEFLGKKIVDVFQGDLPERHMSMVDRALETGELQVYNYHLKVGGEDHIFEARLVKAGNDKVVAVVRDITRERRLEEQLNQAMKMEAIGRLAGGVAHDFNNALTPIIMITAALLNELNDRDPIREDMEDIQEAANRCADLTRQLLAFGRRQALQTRVFNLNDVVASMEKMLFRVIGEDVELTKFLAPDLGNVKADVGQIEQILANLAVNARDAMPGGGKLAIETANVELSREYAKRHASVTPGQYVMIAVSDSGTGIDEQTRIHIFEPFFTTKERGKGTGLGLSTVYGIVKQSGGYIWVYSEPGEGTAFKIYLPRVEDEAEKLKKRERDGAESWRGSETILLVEDDGYVRKVASRILLKLGYKVIEAANGEQAIKICAAYSGKIHLIVTDVVMPGMSGKELVGRLSKSCPEMKIIYVSGYTDNAIVHHGVLDPGTNFLQKPFTSQTLARKIREVLDGDKRE